jgi:hypothetical protein
MPACNTKVFCFCGCRHCAATAQGRVTDGKLSLAYGPWAEHAAAALRAGGVTCGVTHSWEEFSIKMVTKLLWSCLFWMMSAALGGKPVSGWASCIYCCGYSLFDGAMYVSWAAIDAAHSCCDDEKRGAAGAMYVPYTHGGGVSTVHTHQLPAHCGSRPGDQ